MKIKKINEKKYLIRLEKGEMILENIKNFCEIENVKLGEIRALGAVDFVDILIYNPTTKGYTSEKFSRPFEITSLYGNISQKEGKPYLHVHISLAGEDFQMIGGHLSEAKVSATLEAFVDVLDGEVERFFDDKETKLNLWDIK